MIPNGEGVFEHVANVREEEFGEFFLSIRPWRWRSTSSAWRRPASKGS